VENRVMVKSVDATDMIEPLYGNLLSGSFQFQRNLLLDFVSTSTFSRLIVLFFDLFSFWSVNHTLILNSHFLS
jgi:hypothetical protein